MNKQQRTNLLHLHAQSFCLWPNWIVDTKPRRCPTCLTAAALLWMFSSYPLHLPTQSWNHRLRFKFFVIWTSYEIFVDDFTDTKYVKESLQNFLFNVARHWFHAKGFWLWNVFSPGRIDMQSLLLCCIMTRRSDALLEGCPQTASPLPCNSQIFLAFEEASVLNAVKITKLSLCLYHSFFIWPDTFGTGLRHVRWIKEENEQMHKHVLVFCFDCFGGCKAEELLFPFLWGTYEQIEKVTECSFFPEGFSSCPRPLNCGLSQWVCTA